MPSFSHNARSMATSILSHSSSLASCIYISLHLNYSQLFIFLNGIIYIFIPVPIWKVHCHQMIDRRVILAECWFLSQWRWKWGTTDRGAGRSTARSECVAFGKDREANGIVTNKLKWILNYNAIPSSPCSSGELVVITLGPTVRVGEMAP